MKPVAIDFETKAIGPRPDEYPPEPVGVAIYEPSKLPVYLAWGHPIENNSSFRKAKAKLYDYWNGRRPMVFHNAPFDLEVANKWMDLHYPPWHMVHDTQILAFLHDPHARKLDLKSLADSLLDMPPDEQSELRDWILTNVPEAKRAKTQWGKHICKAPGRLVGKYAKGDVVRTLKLYSFFIKDTPIPANNRERELSPILLASNIRGVPIAKHKLEKDLRVLEPAMETVDQKIRNRLKTPDLEIDSPKQLVEALDRCKLVNHWILTPKGGRSAAAKALEKTCKDKHLIDLMNYRGRLKTGLRTFGNSWLKEAYDDRLHFRWNQTTGVEEGGRVFGARTGRLSSTPNAQNMPGERPDHNLGAEFPPLPHPREYIKPEKGHVLLGRDYSQQELRILAWYLGGPVAYATSTEVADGFKANQKMDLHAYGQKMLEDEYGIVLKRKHVKNLAFGILYGMGVKRMSESLNVDLAKGKDIIKAYKDVLVGLSDFQRIMKEDQGVLTWGGRWYDVEPPTMRTEYVYNISGQLVEEEVEDRSFEYKLLNYAIQGSAAEASKQAIINMNSALRESIFYLSVHDEVLVSCPKGAEKEEMQRMNEAMLDVDFSPIQMISDGKISARNWASMRTYK